VLCFEFRDEWREPHFPAYQSMDVASATDTAAMKASPPNSPDAIYATMPNLSA
jgi:hypothetical protein